LALVLNAPQDLQCSIVIALAPELAGALEGAASSSVVDPFLRFLAPPSPADLRLGAMTGLVNQLEEQMRQSRLTGSLVHDVSQLHVPSLVYVH